MLDIRATSFVSPVSEVTFESIPLTVHIVNVADETGLVTGKFRVYNDTTGLLIHSSDIAPFSLAAGAAVDVSALTDFDPPAPADDVYFVIFDGNASNALVPDGINFTLGAFYFDVKPAPLGPIPAGHHVTHEFTGIDEVDVTDLSGLLADPQTPILHHLEHEDGGGDEINVTGLAGELTDDQPPKAHGNAAHTSTFEDQANKGIAGGYCPLPNPLETTRPLRADGTAEFPLGLRYVDDLLSDSGTRPWFFGAINSGTHTPQAGTPDHPGINRFSARPTPGSTSGYWIGLGSAYSQILLAGGSIARFHFQPLTLAGSTIRLGFLDTISSADATDGVYIEMTQIGGVDGTIVGKTAAAGVRSSTGTSFVLVTSTWYKAVISLNAAANLATFQLYSAAGALLWTDTLAANIPTAAGQETSHGLVATNTTGSSTTIVDIDYLDIEIRRAFAR